MQGVIAIIKALSEAKIPSLLLIALIFIVGGWLLIGSTNVSSINPYTATAGGGMLLLGAILSIITFVDFRNKDHIAYLLKQYQGALESIGRTHSTFEQKEQTNISGSSSLKTIGGEKGEYSIDEATSSTPTR